MRHQCRKCSFTSIHNRRNTREGSPRTGRFRGSSGKSLRLLATEPIARLAFQAADLAEGGLTGRGCCGLSFSHFAAGFSPIDVAAWAEGIPAVSRIAADAVGSLHGDTLTSGAIEITVTTSGQTVILGTRSCVGGKIEHLDAKSNGGSVNTMAWKHAAFQPLLMQRIALARSKCAKWQKSAGKTNEFGNAKIVPDTGTKSCAKGVRRPQNLKRVKAAPPQLSPPQICTRCVSAGACT